MEANPLLGSPASQLFLLDKIKAGHMDDVERRIYQAERMAVRQKIVKIDADIDMAITFLRMARTALDLDHCTDEFMDTAKQYYERAVKKTAAILDQKELLRLTEKQRVLLEGIEDVGRLNVKRKG